MNKINERPFKLIGTTYEDYKKYCSKYKYKLYTQVSKIEFFSKVKQGIITKTKDGKLLENGKEI